MTLSINYIKSLQELISAISAVFSLRVHITNHSRVCEHSTSAHSVSGYIHSLNLSNVCETKMEQRTTCPFRDGSDID